ncbi:hypothetical protein AALB39_06935 [Lachnospiraceae bacterium 54-53]
MNIKKIVKEMTLEEKAGLCSGADFWRTKALKRPGIPASMVSDVSDGPHGLRKQDDKSDHPGVNDSIQAVCFPAACATASSFDRELITAMGEALGGECQAEDIHAGASSRDLRESVSVKMESTVSVPVVYHMNSTVGDILSDSEVAELIEPFLYRYKKNSDFGNHEGEAAESAISQQMDDAMLRYMPLRQMLSFAPGVNTPEEFQELVSRMNEKKRAGGCIYPVISIQ